jgi:putative acetyltransferase
VIVRRERPEDAAEIARLLDAAFGEQEVSAFTSELRATDGYEPELTFVAEEEGEIVGFTMLSRVTLGARRVLTLTPVAVRPDRQRAGVGKAVVRAAIAAADKRGEPVLLVEGVPSYYPQFGFRPAAELGIEKPDPRIPDAAWMALPLSAYDPSVRGVVVYPGFFPPPPGA